MPGGDHTGPMGRGPRTGRGAGPCNGNTMSGNGKRGFSGGQGRRGHRHRFLATGLTGWQRAAMTEPEPAVTPPLSSSIEETVQTLEAQAEATTAALVELHQRIDELAARIPPRDSGQESTDGT